MISGTQDFRYSNFLIEKYYDTLPLYRKILMKFSEKYRISKEEYDEWFKDTTSKTFETFNKQL